MKWLKFFLMMLLVFYYGEVAFAYDNHSYPYDITSGCINTCYGDAYGFCKNNCTSYVAYMLNRHGVLFTNGSYRISKYNHCSNDNKWGNGGCWDDAARNAGISVDNYPLPGDVAYWNNLGGVGHIAWVEKVQYDSKANVICIDFTQYNVKSCQFSEKVNVKLGTSDYPDGFIHILAYEEGVTSLHYLDCYEMGCFGQTFEEWNIIANKVWNDYRCKNCKGMYDVATINQIASGFGGASKPDIIHSSLPDFKASEKYLLDEGGEETEKFRPKKTIKIKTRVKNSGQKSPADIKVKYYLSKGESVDKDKEKIGEDKISKKDLGKGENESVTKTFEAPSENGTYNILIQIDSDNSVKESNEKNNEEKIIFTVDDLNWLIPLILNAPTTPEEQQQ